MKILFDSSDNTLIYEIDIFNKAKAIHRVEIIESYASGSNDRLRNTINTNYYNETFNND